MAGSYKLASFVSKPVEEKKLVAPLQKLLDDFLSYAAERDGWRVELVAAESAQAELEEGEQEESVVAEDLDDEDDKTKAPESRHSSSLSQPRPVLYKKRFDFEYLEIVPALDVFDGVVTFHHATAGNQVSPILMSFDSEGFDGTAENVDVFVKALALDASLLLSVEASRLAGAESDGGVAYRWVQTLAGLEADMAYSDSQRCIAAFFKALAAASPLQFSKPATNKAEAPSSNAMEI